MDNTKRRFEDYQKDVLDELKRYANFKVPDREAQRYMQSTEVHERIQKGYLQGDSAATCAWAIDMLY